MSEREAGVAVAEAPIELVINGETYRLRVQSNWSLQHVLHNELGLTGAKDFCDRGVCGSCARDGRLVCRDGPVFRFPGSE